MALAEQIERLGNMTPTQLKSEWRRVYKGAPPAAYTPDLLLRGIAYRLQEKALGGLPVELRRELDSLATIGGMTPRPAKPQSVKLKAGNRLVRRWRGTTHTVMVTEAGFLFQDRRYSSLSTIATEITGTKWSGPRFFGLTGKAA